MTFWFLARNFYRLSISDIVMLVISFGVFSWRSGLLCFSIFTAGFSYLLSSFKRFWPVISDPSKTFKLLPPVSFLSYRIILVEIGNSKSNLGIVAFDEVRPWLLSASSLRSLYEVGIGRCCKRCWFCTIAISSFGERMSRLGATYCCWICWTFNIY